MMKTDGWPTYHLASVVDDHHMGISHVLRGEEWLPSVTKHHQLYRAFGWDAPKFAHLPLLVNADGTKLSKRTGDVHVEQYAQKGYEPEAMLNFLALLGWDYHSAKREGVDKDAEEVFSLPELIDAFGIDGITNRRSAVTLNKLDFINKMTLRRKATDPATNEQGRDVLVDRFQRDLKADETLKANPLVQDTAYVGKVFDTELERVSLLNEMPAASLFYFLDPVYTDAAPQALFGKLKRDAYGELISPHQLTTDDAVSTVIAQLAASSDDLSTASAWDVIHTAFDKLSFKKKDITMSLRHALTGKPQGPTVAEIMSVLGRERSLSRLRAGLAFVQAN